MKKYILFAFAIFLAINAGGQQVHVDATLFVSGNKIGDGIQNIIPTSDKGILFVGYDYFNPGGIIPYFPLDTSGNPNVMIGKVDSNQK